MADPSGAPAHVVAGVPRGVALREVRRRDLGPYFALALATSGPLDEALGLRGRAERQFRSVSGPGLWLLLSVLRLLHRSPVRMLVATEDGAPVGTTVTILLGPWAYVAAVGVRDDRRQRGIAQALVRWAETFGHAAGKSWMVLEVDATNQPARALYAKLGWGPGATVHWWELPGEPAERPPSTVRKARRSDRMLGHAASVRSLGIEFPPRYLHPCELIGRSAGGSRETWAAGPVGEPGLVVRSCAGVAGEPGFLLPAVTGGGTPDPEGTLLSCARAGLVQRGCRGIFVPVLGDAPQLVELLRGAGGTPKVASEFWWKRIDAS